MKILHVAGARPNFMKVAPVLAALAERDGVSQVLVHTGQHYDENMSNVFFGQLGLHFAVQVQVGENLRQGTGRRLTNRRGLFPAL